MLSASRCSCLQVSLPPHVSLPNETTRGISQQLFPRSWNMSLTNTSHKIACFLVILQRNICPRSLPGRYLRPSCFALTMSCFGIVLLRVHFRRLSPHEPTSYCARNSFSYMRLCPSRSSTPLTVVLCIWTGSEWKWGLSLFRLHQRWQTLNLDWKISITNEPNCDPRMLFFWISLPSEEQQWRALGFMLFVFLKVGVNLLRIL